MFCFRVRNQLISDGYVIFSVNPFLRLVQIFAGKFKFKNEKVQYLSSYSLFYRTFNLELKIRTFFSFRLWWATKLFWEALEKNGIKQTSQISYMEKQKGSSGVADVVWFWDSANLQKNISISTAETSKLVYLIPKCIDILFGIQPWDI